VQFGYRRYGVEPDEFVAEVYRRMSLLSSGGGYKSFDEISESPPAKTAIFNYAAILPADLESEILDIGYGGGWFIAACVKLGYKNVTGLDFGGNKKICDWPGVKESLVVERNISDSLADKSESFDFIHMSHVIEHIPKYSLLATLDAVFAALRPGGTVLVRTPNMEGPCANSSLFVTLAHEYGFCGSNLKSLLELCGFGSVAFHSFTVPSPSYKQRIGNVLRYVCIKWNSVKHRLFGVNVGGSFGQELIVTARRKEAIVPVSS
jgi:2-polyprenyl-3-methyl-5-hydroxy-6-metoxy-1,4-benzoquinol methylase